jgi:hypothetical protein
MLDDVKNLLSWSRKPERLICSSRRKKRLGWEDQFRNFLTSERASTAVESLWTEKKALK